MSLEKVPLTNTFSQSCLQGISCHYKPQVLGPAPSPLFVCLIQTTMGKAVGNDDRIPWCSHSLEPLAPVQFSPALPPK